MEFALELQLGNDAMQTSGDIAKRLREVADLLDVTDFGGSIAERDECVVSIADTNGNTVGSWSLTAA